MSITFVKTIFNDSGLTYIWQSQFFNGSIQNWNNFITTI